MKGFHNYYVYIVECSDGSYYTGVTNDLELRLIQHNSGENFKSYTFSRKPVVLKYYEHYNNISNAIAREKQIKGWTRKKKEALFREDWDVLKVLSKNRQAGNDEKVHSD